MRRLLCVISMILTSWAAVAQPSSEPAVPTIDPAVTSPASPQSTSSNPPATTQASTQQGGTFWVPAPEERWWFPKGNWIYGYA